MGVIGNDKILYLLNLFYFDWRAMEVIDFYLFIYFDWSSNVWAFEAYKTRVAKRNGSDRRWKSRALGDINEAIGA